MPLYSPNIGSVLFGSTFAPATSTGPTTVTGSVASTLLAGGLTTPISGLAAGQVYTFKAWGTMTTTVATQTVDLAFYHGGIAGTKLIEFGAVKPNASATVTNAAWETDFHIVMNSATSMSVAAKVYLNFYLSASTQAVTTVDALTAKQFALGITNSDVAVSTTCNGFSSIRIV